MKGERVGMCAEVDWCVGREIWGGKIYLNVVNIQDAD